MSWNESLPGPLDLVRFRPLPVAEQLSQALVLCTTGHNLVLDRGGMPYALHPLRVMYKLRTTDMELMCIALLHDYVEDVKGTSFTQLKQRGFSDRVVEGVRCLTKITGETQEEYEAKVMSNRDSVRVKMQDITHNSDLRRLKGVTQKDLDRTQKYVLFYHKLKSLADSWDQKG
jgi:GTP diphosphokinase / guanosine-3',5'-bis(diphosphate) 3'-diphosphatase